MKQLGYLIFFFKKTMIKWIEVMKHSGEVPFKDWKLLEAANADASCPKSEST